jgi:branched-subunit amino acid aminotransferase/4-amino-4-deoxychorismate lyase
MIWVAGKVVEDHELAIPCTDRVFQHGLGLFETLRTWGRRARLLPRHLDRLRRSAESLGLPFDPDALPDYAGVASLLEGAGIEGEAALRIVLTGGRGSGAGVVWMTAQPASEAGGLWGARASWRLAEPSPLAGHKTLNYWRNRLMHEDASRAGFDEDLGRDALGRFLEGTRANLFVVTGGRLLTPAADGRLLPGVMRGLILERAVEAGLVAQEVEGGLTEREMRAADGAFLSNSGRGMIRLVRIDLSEGGRIEFPVEIPASMARLEAVVRAWLEEEELR